MREIDEFEEKYDVEFVCNEMFLIRKVFIFN